jgi:CubicO group peptidase (beta-lactamase class C family)
MTNLLDSFLIAQMQENHIPSLSLAVINGGTIAKVRGYGFTDQTGEFPITTSTLFQAGSISKCVTALAALRLVDQGRLSLDEDLKNKLASWKIPASEFIRNDVVTLRRLLSHNAGVTITDLQAMKSVDPFPPSFRF